MEKFVLEAYRIEIIHDESNVLNRTCFTETRKCKYDSLPIILCSFRSSKKEKLWEEMTTRILPQIRLLTHPVS